MRSSSCRGLLATTLSLFLAGTNAQTGTLTDLGTTLSSQPNLTTFYGLIQKYPDILLQLPSYNGVTILAPSNEAFSRIPYTALNTAFSTNNQDTITNVLEYHIAQGTRIAAQLVPGTPLFVPTLLTSPEWANVTGGQRVEIVEQAGDVVVFVSGKGSRSTLLSADIEFTGGVIQIIDDLLIPPTNIIDTTTAFNLNSFQGALYASKDNGTFNAANVTVFAPSNAAFEALGPAIINMTAEELATVMEYHLVPGGVFYSTSLTNGTQLTTKQGGKLTVRQSGNNFYINSAQLLTTDVLIANGVLHVIDNVLNPQGPGAIPNPALATQVPAFASASSVKDLPFTSAIPCSSNCPAPATTASKSSSSTAKATGTASSTAGSFQTSSSKGAAAWPARETGFGAAGLMVALGGAVMMI
jgi:transforming growth factor-beta-induced protein